MNALPLIDPLVSAALDPRHSVVVEACAGSGKTWLLVSRIVRLLLAGSAPSEILAITFTRKAAQEMQARLNDWLRLLAIAPETEVRAFLRQRALSDDEIACSLPQARRLYELALHSRPGVTINTFHGWFLDLLQHAPLQTGASGSVALLEQTSPLIDEAWQALAEQLLDAPDSATAHSLTHLFRDYGLSNTRDLMQRFITHRAEWWTYTQGQADPTAFALEQLSAELGIDFDQEILPPLFADEVLSAALERFADLLAGLVRGHPLIHAIRANLHAFAPEVRNELDELLAVFDLLLDLRRVRRVKFADAPRTPKDHPAIGKLLFDVFALLRRERWLDAMLVRGPTLDRVDTDALANPQRRRQIPPRGHVVGHEPEFELRGQGFSSRQRGRQPRGPDGGKERATREGVHGWLRK